MLADADLCLLGLGSGIGLNSVVKLLGGRGAFYHLAKNNYRFDALQAYCFGINI